MLGDSKARQICEATHHEWKEEYYGYKCETCGEFIPYGCEPWMPLDDEEEDYHSYDCTCEDCLQNHPERDILYGDGEYFDWTGLTDDEAAEHSVHLTGLNVAPNPRRVRSNRPASNANRYVALCSKGVLWKKQV